MKWMRLTLLLCLPAISSIAGDVVISANHQVKSDPIFENMVQKIRRAHRDSGFSIDWLSYSNVIEVSGSKFCLIRPGIADDERVFLIEWSENGAYLLDCFLSAPSKWFVKKGRLGFAWYYNGNSGGIYEVVAMCDSASCSYRPSLTTGKRFVRRSNAKVVTPKRRENGLAGVKERARNDSLWQNNKDEEIRKLMPGYVDTERLPGYMDLEDPKQIYLKPMIYLYPDSAMPVDVRIGPVSSLAMTYPKDDSGRWQVQAYPDGRLVERKSGKEFYGLYWEGKNWVPPASDTGVVVRGSEFAQVLDSLLELKGLNFRERQECVTFWMHSLVNSPWVMIQFFDQEFSQAHPLSVSPTPTTMLRVALSFRKLKSYVRLHPPVLTKPARRGFTVVEWGGQVRDGEAIGDQ